MWRVILLLFLWFPVALAGAETTTRVAQGLDVRVTSLNPFSLSSLETFQVLSNVIEPLAILDPVTEELNPWLAESWELLPKAKAFRVKLRKGVKFQDGSELRAEDLKFSFEAFTNLEYKSGGWQGMFGEVTSARVVDPLTVEFKMKSWRYQPFVSVMTSLRVLPKSYYALVDHEKFRGAITGTGPFRLVKFEAGKSIEFEPHKGWWNHKAGVPGFHLLVKPVADPLMAQQMLNKKQLDFYRIPTAEAGTNLLTLRKFEVLETDSGLGEGFGIALNMRKPLFQDPKVREALLRLWDRESLNKKIYGGNFRLALDLLSPKLPYYPPGEPVKFDLKKAHELLGEAGWTDADKDSVLEKKINGRTERLEFTVIVRRGEEERWMSLYRANAAKAGVRVRLELISEEAAFLPLAREGKFDAYVTGGGLGAGFFRVTSHSEGLYNFSGMKNKEMDRLLDQLEVEFEPKRRADIQARLARMDRKKLHILPGLYSRRERFLHSPRLLVDPAHVERVWAWRLKD